MWEETGIEAISLEEIGQSASHDTLYFNFLCETDCAKSSVRLQEGERISCKWVSEEDFVVFVNSREMIGIQRLRYQPYFQKMGYLK